MSYLYNLPFDITTNSSTITSINEAGVTTIIDNEFGSDVRGSVRLADWDDIVSQGFYWGNTFYDVLNLIPGVNTTSSCSTHKKRKFFISNQSISQAQAAGEATWTHSSTKASQNNYWSGTSPTFQIMSKYYVKYGTSTYKPFLLGNRLTGNCNSTTSLTTGDTALCGEDGLHKIATVFKGDPKPYNSAAVNFRHSLGIEASNCSSWRSIVWFPNWKKNAGINSIVFGYGSARITLTWDNGQEKFIGTNGGKTYELSLSGKRWSFTENSNLKAYHDLQDTLLSSNWEYIVLSSVPDIQESSSWTKVSSSDPDSSLKQANGVAIGDPHIKPLFGKPYVI